MTFHAEPALIASACRILPSLVRISYVEGSKEYYGIAESVMQSITRGLGLSRGGDPKNQASFFKLARETIDILGLQSVKYMRQVATLACIQLTEFSDFDALDQAVDVIAALVRNAWPRIFGICGIVLRDVGRCWRRINKGLGQDVMFQRVTKEEVERLKEKFCGILERLEFYCKGNEECREDFRLMRSMRDGEFACLFKARLFNRVGR